MIETPRPTPAARERRSALASLRAVVRLLFLSARVVGEARRGKLTREKVDLNCEMLGKGCLEDAQIELIVKGLDQLDLSKPYLFMSNHQSLYDIPILFAALKGRLRMVAKKELFKVPIWGQALQVAEFVSIDRKDRYKAVQSLKEAARLMQSGINVWMAPEGTRSRDGKLLPFKKGGFMLALETGAQIVPVAINGAWTVIPPKSFRLRLGQRVEVEFGAPIDASAFGVERRDALMREVREWMEARVSPETRVLSEPVGTP
ncbi:1-acyl-sn-glycerol-3-phosphate acyltransferase [compost metagenome]